MTSRASRRRVARTARTIGTAVLGMLLAVAGIVRGAEDERGERREAPHYESPILSLLLLPVNLLIRMTSVLAQESPRSGKTEEQNTER